MIHEHFESRETAWCPGCGNFAILDCLKKALTELGKSPSEVLVAAGIGQAAKTPQFITANAFCGLHGRALPPATAIKIANESLTVILDTGDGDSYGEGGNHFLHAIRRNIDLAHFVHDNQIYGLTKGQASPTTGQGHVTSAQPGGSQNTPLNPLLIALAAGAGFVARGFTGERDQLVDLMKQAISFRGYALLDIFQPCVSFNKINTHQDYARRTYRLDDSYDPTDRLAAMALAMETGDRMPLGVLYRVESPTFHDRNPVLREGGPLLDRPFDPALIAGFLRELV